MKLADALAERRRLNLESQGHETRICRNHGGETRVGRTPSDREGVTFYCPIGHELWRLTKTLNDVGQLPPLDYGWKP